jgi:hypothetical protein
MQSDLLFAGFCAGLNGDDWECDGESCLPQSFPPDQGKLRTDALSPLFVGNCVSERGLLLTSLPSELSDLTSLFLPSHFRQAITCSG